MNYFSSFVASIRSLQTSRTGSTSNAMSPRCSPSLSSRRCRSRRSGGCVPLCFLYMISSGSMSYSYSYSGLGDVDSMRRSCTTLSQQLQLSASKSSVRGEHSVGCTVRGCTSGSCIKRCVSTGRRRWRG